MLLSREGREQRRTIAWSVAATHVLFTLFLQLELYVQTATPTIAFFPLLWPLAQGQGVLIGTALGMLAWAVHRGVGRWIAFLVASILTLCLVADKTIFQYMYTHLRLGMSDGPLPVEQLFRSFAAIVDARLAFDMFVTMLLIAFLYRTLVKQRISAWQRRLFRRWRSCAAYAVVCVLAIPFVRLEDLETHPVFALLEPRPKRSVARQGTPELNSDLFKPRFGTYADKDVIAWEKPRKTPNIMLIVLESVGSLQLLGPDGDLSPELTPFLHGLRDQSVLFPEIYTPFPGTSIAHTFLQTGGLGITSGSVFIALDKPYRGQTLPGVLNANGYTTMMVSSGALNEGNMNLFYEGLGFERYFDFNRADKEFKSTRRLGPWGGDEAILSEQLAAWLDERAADDEQPFFATLLPISTHHPYSVPDGYRGPRSGKGDRDRYENSIHYTDAMVRQIFATLAARGELDDTLVFITGDHGQAFGDLHARNHIHRGRLFEENIRTFLMVVDPRRAGTGVKISRRIGWLGDVMPTILSAAGLPAPQTMIGQDLLASVFTERLAFFHKAESPTQWGLRDGQWKFIMNAYGDAAASLYDLSVDPTEQIDVASAHPAKVAMYAKLCRDWYFGTQAAFDKNVPGLVPPRSAEGVLAPGMKRVAPGITDQLGVFRFTDIAASDRPLTLGASFAPFPIPKRVRFEVTSPSGKPYDAFRTIVPEFHRFVIRMPAPVPLEAGRWSVRVWHSQKLIFETAVNVVAAER